MLKYSVVKNATTANSRHFVAHVSSPESKSLDNVINYMIGEGPALTRPANQRFKKGWLNRLVDFRSFPTIVCILALVLCLSGCKSIPAETKVHSQSEANEKIENDVVFSNDKQSDRNVESHSFMDSEESSVSQTKITHYDTTLPKDTVTGNYPVKSISETMTVRGNKINRRDAACHVSTVRELSQQTDKSKTVMQKTEEIREQQSVKDPYRWRYIAPAIIAIITGCFVLFRKC